MLFTENQHTQTDTFDQTILYNNKNRLLNIAMQSKTSDF